MSNPPPIRHYWNSYGQDRVDADFIDRFVADAVHSLSKCRGGRLHIVGYTPPWWVTPRIGRVTVDPGYFCLYLTPPDGDDGMSSEIDIIFGYYEGGDFLRRRLDESEKAELAQGGQVETIAFNFDEAWQITCLIGEKLGISELRISCGGA